MSGKVSARRKVTITDPKASGKATPLKNIISKALMAKTTPSKAISTRGNPAPDIPVDVQATPSKPLVSILVKTRQNL